MTNPTDDRNPDETGTAEASTTETSTDEKDSGPVLADRIPHAVAPDPVPAAPRPGSRLREIGWKIGGGLTAAAALLLIGAGGGYVVGREFDGTHDGESHHSRYDDHRTGDGHDDGESHHDGEGDDESDR
ncbi:MAG: hypothetical protein QM809_15645 [Gordonia sp. (in: high G+C Gram-positive bacteria)]|uniref:hypothetical protein n=1 Tax=Gordonia sp. (in: high G+C Gram-positive bacteria) TaxID=84139 RepID=UPI0039E54C2A